MNTIAAYLADTLTSEATALDAWKAWRRMGTATVPAEALEDLDAFNEAVARRAHGANVTYGSVRAERVAEGQAVLALVAA